MFANISTVRSWFCAGTKWIINLVVYSLLRVIYNKANTRNTSKIIIKLFSLGLVCSVYKCINIDFFFPVQQIGKNCLPSWEELFTLSLMIGAKQRVNPLTEGIFKTLWSLMTMQFTITLQLSKVKITKLLHFHWFIHFPSIIFHHLIENFYSDIIHTIKNQIT